MQDEPAGRTTPVAQGAMMAVVTAGVGGYDRLEYRPMPIPAPGPGEVLLSVLAAGVNNTDINTRLGWCRIASIFEILRARAKSCR